MTDAYLVTVMLVLLVLGGVIGSGVTILAYRRRELLEYRKRARLAEAGEDHRQDGFVDHLLSRFDSLEERVDFAEQLMIDRPSRKSDEGPV